MNAKQPKQEVIMMQLGITFKDLKKIRKALMNMRGIYKKMTKKQMEVLIQANGGEVEMRRRMGMK